MHTTPFTSLGLSPSLARAACALGFATPSPVQEQAIPAILGGADVLGLAPTGSGKTAAFALPLLQRLQHARVADRNRAQALVLCPTRELALQTGAVLRTLARQLPDRVKIAVAHGGVSINPQMLALRGGADVVVATPGRLLDLVAHNALHLDGVHMLVMDEADRMLDQGFADEVAQVLALLPAARQSLFFSATFPPSVEALASSLLKAPLRVEVVPSEGAAPDILQRAIVVDSNRRTQLLRHLVQNQAWTSVLVFVATRYSANLVADKLYKQGIFATPFHGDLSQGARQEVLDELKAGRWDVVVTTDLAARGLDVARLPVVVNYDLPRSTDDYTHRIGRTGRAGQTGIAVSFVSPGTEAHFKLIEKRQGITLPREIIPGFEVTEPSPAPSSGTGGIKGKRPSKKDKLRAAAAAQLPD